MTTVFASLSTVASFTKSPEGSMRECFRSAITSSILLYRRSTLFCVHL
ncbi:hypothetical protein EVA_16621 [gut metagenome]|uniref:Uncharacterized protein n=1 Tax=gut metagenome TaxID=749906 RepID=J9G6Z2_9ZZZZ